HALAGEGAVAGQSGLAEPHRFGLQPSFPLALAQPRLEEVVLNDREAEVVAVAQEHRAGLGTRYAPGLREDALEEHPEIPLARERDPDLEELVEESRQVSHDPAQSGATRFRPSRFAS